MCSCASSCGNRWNKWMALSILVAVAFSILAAPGPDEKPKAPGAAEVKGDPYMMDVCAVTGEKLGSMGDAVVYSYEGREVKFCCKGCQRKFKAAPEKYLGDLDKEIVKSQMAFYPLDKCLASPDGGKPLAVDFVYNNRLVRFCSEDCLKAFKAAPDKYLATLDAAVIEKQLKSYPLQTCAVGGEKLGSMGEPVNIVIGNRLVRVCCSACEAKLRGDPMAALAKLDAAAKKQK